MNCQNNNKIPVIKMQGYCLVYARMSISLNDFYIVYDMMCISISKTYTCVFTFSSLNDTTINHEKLLP